ADAIGVVSALSGRATITGTNGVVRVAHVGDPVYQREVVETDANGEIHFLFVDQSEFAVSQNARLAIDEYVYDPGSDSSASKFSLLRGIFVYVSGLIGKDKKSPLDEWNENGWKEHDCN